MENRDGFSSRVEEKSFTIQYCGPQNNLVMYLAFWIICSMIIVYLLSQKPLNNGLISEKFNGPFMVPAVHRHLVLLHVGMT